MTAVNKTITLGSEPNYNSGRQILAKWAIGLAVGIVVGFLIFIILYMVSGMLTQALQNNVENAGVSAVNPLLPLILIVIAFIATFIGNVMLAWVYNLFYTTKYYDLGKMFSNSLLSNIIIFFVFTPLYLFFYNSINDLFIILSFHILFSIFICYTHVELLTNPNYASSHLIGTTIWVTVSAMIYLVIDKATSGSGAAKNQYIILLPSIIWYLCIPFFHALREKIYYKFYENGNDFLYLPTLQEMHQQEEITTQVVTNNDITVDIN
jgi:hypothetical protein